MSSVRDVYSTATDFDVSADLDRGLLFSAFSRKTLPDLVLADDVSLSLAALRIPSLSAAGGALPAEAILYTSRLWCDRGFWEFGIAGPIRTPLPFAGSGDV